MYYINTLFLYSFFGFCLESTIYKIRHNKRHSGICYGPVTLVYGFGILTLALLKKYFLDKLTCNKWLKLFITYIVCWISLTLIEWIGGNVLYQIFQINMWNYSNKAFHFGKYICLELSLIWGILGTLYIYYVKDFIDKFISLIPHKLTIGLTCIQIIDILLVFINKLP